MLEFSPSSAAQVCGRTARQLWIDYLTLGGAWSIREFADYLVRSDDTGRLTTGPRSPEAVQSDVVAHALNEALMDAAQPGRVPYGRTWGWSGDDLTPTPDPAPAAPRDHALAVVGDRPGQRVLTAVPRGDQLDHRLVCGECGAVLALDHRPPAGFDGVLRCPSCRALNDPAAPLDGPAAPLDGPAPPRLPAVGG